MRAAVWRSKGCTPVFMGADALQGSGNLTDEDRSAARLAHYVGPDIEPGTRAARRQAF
jgi:hypothetical protein